MLDRTYPGQICSVARALEVVGERWSLLILRDALFGFTRFEYVLTEKGRGLGPALLMLMKWGDEHYPTEAGPPVLTLHRGWGGKVDRRMWCSRCREHVEFEDLEL